MSEIIADYQIKADKFLLEYLRPRTTDRTSKLDAFCDLMNMAMSKDSQSEETRFGITVHLHQRQFTVTVTDLAKKWNWHRVTVKSFLDKLVAMNYADMYSEGKFFVITMRYAQSSEHDKNEALFTKDEQRLVRWQSGHRKTAPPISLTYHPEPLQSDPGTARCECGTRHTLYRVLPP